MSNPGNNNNRIAQLNKRAARPQTIAGALGDLMQIFGVRASDADLAQNWAKIMGPDIAAIATLAAVRKNRNNKYTVVIRPSAPAFALQLSYQKNEITEKLNKYFGDDAVEKISFRK